MSPLPSSWRLKLPRLARRERLEIFLASDEIWVKRELRRRNGKQEQPAPVEQPLPVRRGERATAFDAETATPLWQAAVETLAQWLEQEPANIDPTLILSNRFVRFALVPWSDQVKTEQEMQAIALARFKGQYGDMAGWTIRIDPGHYGEARVACAVEAGLLDALQQLLARRGIRRFSVQPHFIACWNREVKGKALPADLVFATSESGSLVLGSRQVDRWRSVRAIQSDTGSDRIQALVEREALLQGFADVPAIKILHNLCI